MTNFRYPSTLLVDPPWLLHLGYSAAGKWGSYQINRPWSLPPRAQTLGRYQPTQSSLWHHGLTNWPCQHSSGVLPNYLFAYDRQLPPSSSFCHQINHPTFPPAFPQIV